MQIVRFLHQRFLEFPYLEEPDKFLLRVTIILYFDITGQTEQTISPNTAIDKQNQTLMEDLELSDSSTSDSEQQCNWRFINNVFSCVISLFIVYYFISLEL